MDLMDDDPDIKAHANCVDHEEEQPDFHGQYRA